MTVLRTEKLTPTVGALVEGVDRDQLLHDDALPDATLEALEATGALVFRGLHLDDEAGQVAAVNIEESGRRGALATFPEVAKREPIGPHLSRWKLGHPQSLSPGPVVRRRVGGAQVDNRYRNARQVRA